MSSGDDERIIRRFVSGLPVDDDALAEAVASRAIDRTAFARALMAALSSDEATARLRACERVARMDHIADDVARMLDRIASADVDTQVRAAAGSALHAHGRHDPEQRPQDAVRYVPSISLRLVSLRSGSSRPRLLLPVNRADAPASALASQLDDGRWHVVVTGLPAAFVGTRPVLRARDGVAPVVLGRAAEPVAPGGEVTIVIPATAGTTQEIERRLATTLDLTLDDD